MKTTNYEISKKLAEAGFEAETEFYWIELNGDLILLHKTQLLSVPFSIKKIAAYDFETILEALPKKIIFNKYFGYEAHLIIDFMQEEMRYYCPDDDTTAVLPHCRTELREEINLVQRSLADTASYLLILLVEKGLIKFGE